MVLAIAIAAIAGWFLLPTAAGVIVADRLTAAGFRGTGTRVMVEADPPLALAALHADRVHVTSTDAQFQGLVIGALDVTLSDVNLLDRTASAVAGTLTELRLESGTGTSWSVSSAEISGSSADARITLRLSAADARLMAAGAVEGKLGSRPTSLTLTAPDRIQFVVRGTAVGGRLVADDEGRLVFQPGGAASSLVGPILLLTPGPDVPLRATSVRVAPDGIVLVAAIDASLILH